MKIYTINAAIILIYLLIGLAIALIETYYELYIESHGTPANIEALSESNNSDDDKLRDDPLTLVLTICVITFGWLILVSLPTPRGWILETHRKYREVRNQNRKSKEENQTK